jgi:hypothetical protein
LAPIIIPTQYTLAMAIDWCEGCGRLFDSDRPGDFYCSDGCRQLAHRRLLDTSQETRTRPAPVRKIFSVREAWEVLPDATGGPDRIDSIWARNVSIAPNLIR